MGLVFLAVKARLLRGQEVESVSAFLTFDLAEVFVGNVALSAPRDPFSARYALVGQMVEEVTIIARARGTFVEGRRDIWHGWVELRLHGQREALICGHTLLAAWE